MKIILRIAGFYLLFTALLFWALKFPSESHLNNPIKFLRNKDCFETKIVYNKAVDVWEIYFTGDNWGWERQLLDLKDYTKDFGWITVWDSGFIGNKQEAIEFARKFNSYEECMKHNEYVKKEGERLLKLYEAQGVPDFETYINRKESQPKKKEPEVKEIIIKSCK